VFCNPFFKTTGMLLQNLVRTQDPNLVFEIYTLTDKLIFDLLSRTNQNAELKNLTEILLSIVDQSDELLMKLVEDRILY
jgi:hypothetical protein